MTGDEPSTPRALATDLGWVKPNASLLLTCPLRVLGLNKSIYVFISKQEDTAVPGTADYDGELGNELRRP